MSDLYFLRRRPRAAPYQLVALAVSPFLYTGAGWGVPFPNDMGWGR